MEGDYSCKSILKLSYFYSSISLFLFLQFSAFHRTGSAGPYIHLVLPNPPNVWARRKDRSFRCLQFLPLRDDRHRYRRSPTPALTHLVPGRTTAARVRRLLTRRRTRRGLVLLLAWRALAVALLRRWATVLTGGSGAALLASLLVLGVVAGVDGAEDEFEDPEIGGELDWGLGAGHFGGFVLVVGGAVDHGADLGVVVELAQEFGCCRAVSVFYQVMAKPLIAYLSDRFRPGRIGRRWHPGRGWRSG